MNIDVVKGGILLVFLVMISFNLDTKVKSVDKQTLKERIWTENTWSKGHYINVVLFLLFIWIVIILKPSIVILSERTLKAGKEESLLTREKAVIKKAKQGDLSALAPLRGMLYLIIQTDIIFL